MILRCQMRFLVVILASVVLGLLISPGKALPGGRLNGVIWPIWSTQVAHFAAEVVGLTVLLWLSRLMTGRRALMLAVPAFVLLLLTHTRTALLAMFIALLVAGFSLFPVRRHVRRAFAAVLIVVVAVGVPAAPYVSHYLARGRTASKFGPHRSYQGLVGGALDSRPTTNLIFGSGLSNDAVNGSPNAAENGLAHRQQLDLDLPGPRHCW